MDIQDQSKPFTPPGHESHGVHTCRRCGWPFPNPHPSSKHRRAHKRICGTIEGYTKLIIDSGAVSGDEHHSDSDCEHHSDSDDEAKERNPSPKIEKRIIKESGSSAGGIEEKSNRSEDDRFSDAVTEFSDTGISPRVVSEVKKMEGYSEVFETPIPHSKDADKIQEQDLNAEPNKIPNTDMKHSVPLVEDSDGSHKDVYALSIPSDIPLVDKAETLIEDFKDHKTMYSNVSGEGKHVDILEVKIMQENVHESETSEHDDFAFVPTVVMEESKVAEICPLAFSKTFPESEDNVSEAEASSDKHSIMTLGEQIEAEIKEAEIDHSVVSDSKESVKVGTSETVVDEGSGKLLSGQDGGVDVSFDMSSRDSLEGNWGSVSEISDVVGKSEISDDRNRLGRSDAFEGLSLVESEQEIIEQTASEMKSVKVQKSQPPKSEASVSNGTEDRKRNEEAIAKVTNWSTSEHIATSPLRKLISEAKSHNPKPLSNVIQKDKGPSEPGKSNLTQESQNVNQESSSVKYSGEDNSDKKKTKGIPLWLRFLCCSMPIKR